MIELENLEKTLDRIQDWIKTADQKVGVLLTLETAIFTLLFLDAYRWVKQNILLFHWWQVLLLCASLTLGIYSFVKLLVAITPKLNKKEHPLSFTYFGDIAKMSVKEHTSLLTKSSKEDYLKEITCQIFINAQICNKKHYAFRFSLITFVWFLITTAVLVLSKKIS